MPVRSRLIGIAAAWVLAALCAGCVTSSTTEAISAVPPGESVVLHLLPCSDRTGTTGRDLGAEATAALQAKITRAGFRLDDTGPYELSCEVTVFAEGSALKRWLVPGWGATIGQIAVMVMDRRTGQIAVIIRGNATVAGGGLYTIGADSYILDAAVEDVVRQLQKWAGGQGSPRAARNLPWDSPA